MKSEHDLIRNNMYRRLGIETKPKRDLVQMEAESHKMTKKLSEVVNLARP